MIRFPAPALLGIAILAVAMAGGARAAETVADPSPTWQSLSPQQQQVLQPLQEDWTSLEAERRRKWVEVARRFPTLPQAEQQRIQERMAEWARMTPAERGRARLQFQQSRQIPAEDRQKRWEAYKALPAEEREALASRAKPGTGAPAAPAKPADKRAGETVAKSNLVSPSRQAPVKQIAPTVVQAKPGATTTLLTDKAPPPSPHQPGLPKIAATQGFVDPRTLLPKRGPQGAAVAQPAVPAEAQPQ